MSTVHWLGAGLSSGPGIRRIAASGTPLILWNRTIERAHAVFEGQKPGANVQVRALDQKKLEEAVGAGDVVVSMLPAPMHPDFAAMCLAKKAHLVTTSYVSDAMRGFHDKAKAAGLSFVNECGLDPGIDHVFAHLLVQEFKKHPEYDSSLKLEFRSYCGGIPAVPNDFKYKFSWSPAGVLRALTNQARFVEGGDVRTSNAVWEVVKPMDILGETFEVYPNRDSTIYLDEYHFDKSWNVNTFVRGTIRLGGWKKAWAHLFEMIPTATAQKIEDTGAELWKKHAYAEGERDRVVLFVELKALRDGKEVVRIHYALDETGTGSDTAMARLVSLPATFAVDAILKGNAPLGVSGAPEDRPSIEEWFRHLRAEGVKILTHGV